MKIRPQVMHRMECIDCGQVGGRRKSLGTPRQPSDFKANCTVSRGSAADKCWASGHPHTGLLSSQAEPCRADLFVRRTRFLPDEKTRRPTRLSGHFRATRTELVTGESSRNQTCR